MTIYICISTFYNDLNIPAYAGICWKKNQFFFNKKQEKGRKRKEFAKISLKNPFFIVTKRSQTMKIEKWNKNCIFESLNKVKNSGGNHTYGHEHSRNCPGHSFLHKRLSASGFENLPFDGNRIGQIPAFVAMQIKNKSLFLHRKSNK